MKLSTVYTSARQNRVMVVDKDSGMLLGEVTGIQGAHGTALARNDWSAVMFD